MHSLKIRIPKDIYKEFKEIATDIPEFSYSEFRIKNAAYIEALKNFISTHKHIKEEPKKTKTIYLKISETETMIIDMYKLETELATIPVKKIRQSYPLDKFKVNHHDEKLDELLKE